MKVITKKQRNELEQRLTDLKRVHPRKYKYAAFHLNDLGTGIMLGNIAPEGGAIYRITYFMGYEAMMWFLYYATYPYLIRNEERMFREYGLKTK